MNSTIENTANILLVEDNPGDVLLTKKAFEHMRIKNTLHVTSDGDDALNFLFHRGKYQDAPKPDLILLDLNMPGKDGIEVLKEIKSDDNIKRIPVVIMTSSKAEQDIVKSYNLHANSYIVKPMDQTQFIDIVNAIESFWFYIVKLPDI